MSNSTALEVIVTSGGDRPDDFAKSINAMKDSRAMVTDRANLDGSAGEWMMIASVAATMLPHLVDLLKTYVSNKPTTKIKIGDWEVENPTPEILEEFLRRSQTI